jgi:hypothetical protein
MTLSASQPEISRDCYGTRHSNQRLETKNIGARILEHLVEAEKTTFHEELSFQRSESTLVLLQATVFV